MLEDASKISVDLSEEVTQLEQATLSYCLCRAAYHGDMVGCDTCEEWYHLSCVGLSKVQADKIERYVCVRCAMRASMKATCAVVGNITNRWLVPEERIRQREQRSARYSEEDCS